MADNAAVRAELMLTGRRVAPQDTRRLRAGALDLELDGPDLRRVSFYGIEVLQQLYFAFRDVAWNTLPGVLSDVSIDEGPGATFRAAFTSRHRFPALDLDLSYRSEIVGTEDSELTYSVDVSAHSVVEYNRIGLNLLHGSRTYAGRPYARRSAMWRRPGLFPRRWARWSLSTADSPDCSLRSSGSS